MRRVALLLLFALPLFAQSKDDAVLDKLYAVKRFEDVAISPDGKRVAWIVEGEGAAHHCALDGSDEHLVVSVKGTGADAAGLAWSPDSKHLAFLSDVATPGQRELVLDGAQVTTLRGYLNEPKWSPDGKSIAFLFIENAGRAAGPLVAMSRAVGVVGEEFEEQRVAVLDVATKKIRVVTPADMYVYHFDWSPDSTRLAVEAAMGSGDQNYWIASLHIVDVAKASMREIYKPKLQIADPKWLDDHQIAFIEGLMSDEGSTGGDVMSVADDGTNVRNLTPGMKASATLLLGGTMFLATEHGAPTIKRVGGAELWRGAEAFNAVSVARDGKTSAVIRSSFTTPPEVWVGPIGEGKQLTHLNDGIRAMWGDARSIDWTNDELRMQGWLLFPRDYEASKRYPMVVQVHGGPASAALNRWPREEAAVLAHHGYFVFFPNPRGSYGEGAAFTQANVKDFGYGDLRDIVAGVDAVVKRFPVDERRVGIWGWSYGGFMSMFAVTQTNRFKAAVAGAGIANWQSYYGENDITQWMIPYFGASVYDDPAVYAKSSPITFIKNVKTPTLVLVGERDGECPVPQSFEFWRALKTLGVQTQLVVYPDEGHRFVQMKHRRDLVRRVVDWFDAYLR